MDEGLIHRLAIICKHYYVIRTIDDLFLYAGAKRDWWIPLPEENYPSQRERQFYGWVVGIKNKFPNQFDLILIKVLKEIIATGPLPDSDRDFLQNTLLELDGESGKRGIHIDPLMATLATFLVRDNLTLEASVITSAEASFEFHSHDRGLNRTEYGLILSIPLNVYTHIQDQQAAIQANLFDRIQTITRGIQEEYIDSVIIIPKMIADSGWRDKMAAFLVGQGVNNQGKVRSDNIAPFTHRGLLFRSRAEINLFEALQALGVSFAPLPVFIRGGTEYRRIEPDFIIIKEGITMVVEVDGDTFHRETPAEAQNRTLMLENEGARIVHIQASECNTPEKARMAAKKVLEMLDKIKAARR